MRSTTSPLVLALALAACSRPPAAVLPVEIPVDPASLPEEVDFTAHINRKRGERDCFAPLVDPVLVPAADAPRMSPAERVLGIDLGSVQIAYPVQALNLREIVEQDVAGHHLLVCW